MLLGRNQLESVVATARVADNRGPVEPVRPAVGAAATPSVAVDGVPEHQQQDHDPGRDADDQADVQGEARSRSSTHRGRRSRRGPPACCRRGTIVDAVRRRVGPYGDQGPPGRHRQATSDGRRRPDVASRRRRRQ